MKHAFKFIAQRRLDAYLGNEGRFHGEQCIAFALHNLVFGGKKFPANCGSAFDIFPTLIVAAVPVWLTGAAINDGSPVLTGFCPKRTPESWQSTLRHSPAIIDRWAAAPAMAPSSTEIATYAEHAGRIAAGHRRLHELAATDERTSRAMVERTAKLLRHGARHAGGADSEQAVHFQLATVGQLDGRGAGQPDHRRGLNVDAALFENPALRVVGLERAVEKKRDRPPIGQHHGLRTGERPMSENTINAALRGRGYSAEVHSAHGFRAMARTILDEVLGERVDLIEHQLAHAVTDVNGRAYNRTAHLPARRVMMQRWADYLDQLRRGAKVIQLRTTAMPNAES
jgi:hypothetical protein